MKIISLTCPKCHANLKVDGEHGKVFCQYCGTPIYIDDEVNRTEHTFRTVDEAKISQIMANHDLEIRKLEKKEKDDKSFWKHWSIIMIVLLVFLLICCVAEDWDKVSYYVKEKQGYIKVENPKDYKGESYKTVITKLETLGFTDITTIDLDDAGLFKKADDVVDITINGVADFKKGDLFKSSDKIIITYH